MRFLSIFLLTCEFINNFKFTGKLEGKSGLILGLKYANIYVI